MHADELLDYVRAQNPTIPADVTRRQEIWSKISRDAKDLGQTENVANLIAQVKEIALIKANDVRKANENFDGRNFGLDVGKFERALQDGAAAVMFSDWLSEYDFDFLAAPLRQYGYSL